jgi:hypothetical protein
MLIRNQKGEVEMSNMPNIPTLPTAKKGSPERALVGMGIMAALVVGINSGVTQFVAWRLSYSPALGAPWIAKYYAPWAWTQWAQAPWVGSVSNTFQLAGAGVMLELNSTS